MKPSETTRTNPKILMVSPRRRYESAKEPRIVRFKDGRAAARVPAGLDAGGLGTDPKTIGIVRCYS